MGSDPPGEKPGSDPKNDAFDRLVDPFALPRVAVTQALAPPLAARRNQIDIGNRSLTGTLVHRLFERFGTTLNNRADSSAITDELARLLRDEETVEVDDVDRLFNRARDAYLALCSQPALSETIKSGDAIFEMPFSVRLASAQMILRGTFDCLVRRRDGRISVLELKTGSPAPEHEEQLSVYLSAARALFPGMPVEGKLVYAGQPDLDDRSLDAKR